MKIVEKCHKQFPDVISIKYPKHCSNYAKPAHLLHLTIPATYKNQSYLLSRCHPPCPPAHYSTRFFFSALFSLHPPRPVYSGHKLGSTANPPKLRVNVLSKNPYWRRSFRSFQSLGRSQVELHGRGSAAKIPLHLNLTYFRRPGGKKNPARQTSVSDLTNFQLIGRV